MYYKNEKGIMKYSIFIDSVKVFFVGLHIYLCHDWLFTIFTYRQLEDSKMPRCLFRTDLFQSVCIPSLTLRVAVSIQNGGFLGKWKLSIVLIFIVNIFNLKNNLPWVTYKVNRTELVVINTRTIWYRSTSATTL